MSEPDNGELCMHCGDDLGSCDCCLECGGSHEPSRASIDCILHWKNRALAAENNLRAATEKQKKIAVAIGKLVERLDDCDILARDKLYEELAQQCTCTPLSDRPCAGLMAGGLCDDLHMDEAAP